MATKKPPLFEVTVPITEKMFMSFMEDIEWRLHEENIDLKIKEILARPGYREKLLAKFTTYVKDSLHASAIRERIEDYQGDLAHDVVYGPLFDKDFKEAARQEMEQRRDPDTIFKVKGSQARRAADILIEHGIDVDYE